VVALLVPLDPPLRHPTGVGLSLIVGTLVGGDQVFADGFEVAAGL
jgi:hypothetical protein